MNINLAWIGVLVGFLTWETAAAQPNIVVHLSDDHSQFDSSLYGSEHIPTPNFVKLAADGMTFTHAFVASPSCAPSRAAMLTGLTPAHNGAQANHTFPSSGVHSLIEELKKLGYETAAFGKVAHGKGRQVARYGFDHADPGRSADQLRKNVRAYLKKRDAGKPLCLFVGISNPHVPWPDDTSFEKEKVVLPPTFLDTPDTRRLRAMYLEEVKEFDALLGALRVMAREHLGKDVLFIHTSDHGSQWPFGKWTLYDYGTRVPFIASWPGQIKRGTRTDARARAVVDRFYKRREFELYHVGEDTWEQNNLVDDPKYARRLAALKAELRKWMTEQGDEGFVHAQPRLLSDNKSWHPDFYGTKEQGKE